MMLRKLRIRDLKKYGHQEGRTTTSNFLRKNRFSERSKFALKAAFFNKNFNSGDSNSGDRILN